MKARITGVLLCIGAFFLSMLLLLHLIENPLTKTPDVSGTPSDEGSSQGGDNTANVTTDVTSIEGVMSVAKETQAYFETVSGQLSTEKLSLSDMVVKWHNAALYLKERANDTAGAAYYTALSTAFSAFDEAKPVTPADFALTSSELLSAVGAAAVTEEGEPSGRYPDLDFSENGNVAATLLRFWLKEQKPTGSVTVTYGGEVAMGDYIGASTYQNLYAVDKAQSPLKALIPVFSTDDLSIVALNAPLTTYTVPEVAATEAFRGSAVEAYAKHLKDAGVDAVLLSTCRVHDFGDTGYADTKAVLAAAGLTVVEDSTPVYVNTPAGKVALLAFDLSTLGDVRYTEVPKSKIAEAKNAGARLVVTYFHAADSEKTTETLVNTLRDAAENGADLVLSSHSASMEGILLSQTNQAALVFSPGRLSYAADTSGERDTFLFRQSFALSADGEPATASERFIFAVDNHASDETAPFAPSLMLAAEDASRVQSTLLAALPNFKGRVADGDLTVVSIQK